MQCTASLLPLAYCEPARITYLRQAEERPPAGVVPGMARLVGRSSMSTCLRLRRLSSGVLGGTRAFWCLGVPRHPRPDQRAPAGWG